jgi:hypothetical protein
MFKPARICLVTILCVHAQSLLGRLFLFTRCVNFQFFAQAGTIYHIPLPFLRDSFSTDNCNKFVSLDCLLAMVLGFFSPIEPLNFFSLDSKSKVTELNSFL